MAGQETIENRTVSKGGGALRDTIIQSALRRIQQVGFRKFTIDDIVKDLKISKKTVYKYFATKDEIVAAVAEYLQQTEMARVQAIIAKNISWKEKVAELIPIHFDEHRQPWMYAELMKFYPEVWAKGKRGAEEVKRVLKDLLMEGVKAEEIRADVNLDILIMMLENIGHFLISDERFLDDHQLNHKTAFKQVIHIIAYGVFPRK